MEKEELKKKMIGVIGSYPNSLIESIAEQCAQVAVDFYKEREQALNTSSVACSVCGWEKVKDKECDYCVRQYALNWGL
jgi:hypothetical protein